MEIQEASPKKGLPHIEISDQIKSPECPYDVTIDGVGTAELLRLSGVNEKDIKHTHIRLERKPGRLTRFYESHLYGRLVLATYAPADRTIKVYADRFWDKGQQLIDAANPILDRWDRAGALRTRENFPSRRRLSQYLRYAPKDRAKETVKRLANLHMNRQANSALTHEAHHSSEGKFVGAIEALTLLGKTFFYFVTNKNLIDAYESNGGEKRAFEFQDKQGNNFNLISIKPKSTSLTPTNN